MTSPSIDSAEQQEFHQQHCVLVYLSIRLCTFSSAFSLEISSRNVKNNVMSKLFVVATQ